MKRAIARFAAAAVALAACPGLHAQSSPFKSDWEMEQEKLIVREGEVKLPPRFREENLLEFEIGRTVSFRFFIDRASLDVGTDGVVRYTLVARSPQGAENLSYEGIHCKTGRTKAYAFGQASGGWRAVKQEWMDVEKLWTRVLRTEYFCPKHRVIRSAAEGVYALQRGGHLERGN
ncbi:MAG: CNP1-like family protein [Proteobacteria bacterium]|nr:CNP1-like family protein [Pseudomonadota bacterium]